MDVNMENGKKQICSTFGERKKVYRGKMMFVRSHRFLLSASSPNLVIKETLDVKAGHMLSTAGDKVSMAQL